MIKEALMNNITSFIKRHSLFTFFALVYTLSWWPSLFGGDLFPFGPLLATVIIIGLSEGKPGIKVWWQRVTRWRGA